MSFRVSPGWALTWSRYAVIFSMRKFACQVKLFAADLVAEAQLHATPEDGAFGLVDVVEHVAELRDRVAAAVHLDQYPFAMRDGTQQGELAFHRIAAQPVDQALEAETVLAGRLRRELSVQRFEMRFIGPFFNRHLHGVAPRH